MNEILVEIKSNYGIEAIYPACAKANSFCELLGQKTLTRGNLEKIRGLGFKIDIKQQTL